MRLRPTLLTALLAAAICLSGAASAADPVPTAGELLSKAKERAGSKKSVFVAFHASWCVWCRQLEHFMRLPTVKPVFDRYYEIVWLTVDERKGRKNLENPGADDIRERLGAAGVALPFYSVADPKGMMVAASFRRGGDGKMENIGFPGTPDEISSFLELFRAGAPGLTPAEEKSLRDGLVSLATR